MDERAIAGRGLARAGALWGLVFVLLLTTIRLVADDKPEQDQPLGNLALVVVYSAPFVLALLALLLRRPVQRAALLLAAGVLVFFLGFTAFSGISLVLLPAALLLQLAAWRAYMAAKGQTTWPILPLALGVVAVGIAAFVVLFANDDPRCWALVRLPGGEEVWEARPVSSTLSTNGRVREMTCISDIISSAEGAASLAIWLAGAVGLLALLRRWPSPFDVALQRSARKTYRDSRPSAARVCTAA